MKITVLAENTTKNDELKTEHGLSLYIETQKHKILFDTGQSDLFIRNAKKLGIDLSEVNFAILSHGHYDHGGGLESFFEVNEKAPVYVNRHAFEGHYNGTEKYIGIDAKLEENRRIIFTDDLLRLYGYLELRSCNDKEREYERIPSGLTVKSGDEFVPDDFLHEQYLLINENGRRIVISGCSHKGVLNVANWFEPDVLVGGFHFSKLPLDDTLRGYAEQLDLFDADFYTCHCTGEEQFEFMKQYMGRLQYISTGDTIEI